MTADAKGLTYRDAGVDIDAGDALVDRIAPIAAKTRIAEVVSGVGGFAGLCAVPAGLEEPVLVSGTDGTGTKLKVACLLDRHDTIGIDLVAMCVNDIITTGARPLFFLDYFSTSRLDVDRAARVIGGIARGCELAHCTLLGGETAEHPGGGLPDGEYDLAGFAVGVVERKKIIDGRRVAPGDVVIGVASSGLHSNGYSLARKAIIDVAKLDLRAHDPALGESPGDALLRPTTIYVDALNAARAAGDVRAVSHITGGGLPGNVPRVLPDGLGVVLDATTWPVHPIFRRIAEIGRIDEKEMRRTFNVGLGLVIVAPASDADAILAAVSKTGETGYRVGVVERMEGAVDEARVVFR